MGPETEEDHESKTFQVSGCYKILSGTSPPPAILVEHCCLMTQGNNWYIVIKCRPVRRSYSRGLCQPKGGWRNVREAYPDAKVEQKHNDIEVTLPSLQEDIEIAAFGRPGKDDQKRMQMAIFGRHPTQGRDWKIWVYIVDDTTTAYKQVCQKEEERGHKLLAPLAGMFISNINEDIKIEFNALETGWKIKGSKVKTIKSKDAWNSPENSKDFPCCFFEISHVDKTKQSFFCGIKTSHDEDTASAEIVSYFERVRPNKPCQSYVQSKGSTLDHKLSFPTRRAVPREPQNNFKEDVFQNQQIEVY